MSARPDLTAAEGFGLFLLGLAVIAIGFVVVVVGKAAVLGLIATW